MTNTMSYYGSLTSKEDEESSMVTGKIGFELIKCSKSDTLKYIERHAFASKNQEYDKSSDINDKKVIIIITNNMDEIVDDLRTAKRCNEINLCVSSIVLAVLLILILLNFYHFHFPLIDKLNGR